MGQTSSQGEESRSVQCRTKDNFIGSSDITVSPSSRLDTELTYSDGLTEAFMICAIVFLINGLLSMCNGSVLGTLALFGTMVAGLWWGFSLWPALSDLCRGLNSVEDENSSRPGSEDWLPYAKKFNSTNFVCDESRSVTAGNVRQTHLSLECSKYKILGDNPDKLSLECGISSTSSLDTSGLSSGLTQFVDNVLTSPVTRALDGITNAKLGTTTAIMDESEMSTINDLFVLPDEAVARCQQDSLPIRSLVKLISEGLSFPKDPFKHLLVYRPFFQKMEIHKGLVTYRGVRVVTESVAIQLATQIHLGLNHCGRDKLTNGLRKEAWMPGMVKLSADLTRSCPLCQFTKSSSGMATSPPVQKITPRFPYESCAIDLLQLPSSYQYKYVVAMIDDQSKFISVVPLKSKKAEEVANAIERRVLPTLIRMPNSIRSDGGPEFRSSVFKDLMDKFSVRHHINPPRAPWVGGAVERLNRSLVQEAALQKQKGVSWLTELPRTIINLNQSYHASLKTSPSSFLLEKLHSCEAGVNLPEKPQEFWREGGPHFKTFKVRDWVLVKLDTPGNKAEDKVKCKYGGPYRVHQVNRRGMSFVLQSYPGGQLIFRHFRHLKLFRDIPRRLRKNKFFQEQLLKTLPSYMQLPTMREMNLHLDRLKATPSEDSLTEGPHPILVPKDTQQPPHQRPRPPSLMQDSSSPYHSHVSNTDELSSSSIPRGILVLPHRDDPPDRMLGASSECVPRKESSVTELSIVNEDHTSEKSSSSFIPDDQYDGHSPHDMGGWPDSTQTLAELSGTGNNRIPSPLSLESPEPPADQGSAPVHLESHSSVYPGDLFDETSSFTGSSKGHREQELPLRPPYQTRSKGPVADHPWVADSAF